MISYVFSSLEELALYLEQQGTAARVKASILVNARRIRELNHEAYGYEQSAHIVRNAFIVPTKGEVT